MFMNFILINSAERKNARMYTKIFYYLLKAPFHKGLSIYIFVLQNLLHPLSIKSYLNDVT